MRRMVIMNYWTGARRSVKLNSKAQGCSITYNVEGDRLIIRNYWDNKKLQSIMVDGSSIKFWVEE